MKQGLMRVYSKNGGSLVLNNLFSLIDRAKLYIIVSAPITCLFFIIPADLFYNQITYWNYNKQIFFNFVLYGFVLYCILLIFFYLLYRINSNIAQKASVLLFLVSVILLYCDVFSPLQLPPLDGSPLKSGEPFFNTIIEFIIALFCIALFYKLDVKKVRTLTFYCSILLIMIGLAYTIIIIVVQNPLSGKRIPDAQITDAQITRNNGKSNIYHILLDEMQTNAALLWLRENNLENKFDGFTLFERNISNYVNT